jgi:hypothetical protein
MKDIPEDGRENDGEFQKRYYKQIQEYFAKIW